MSEGIGYEGVLCEFCLRKTDKQGNPVIAGYKRRPKYANEGPWLDACEDCARKPYEQPKQFQKEEQDVQTGNQTTEEQA